uniref:glutathione-specific gamma-glutamylcyclotransferase n=1 Tax=Timema monikensis TaxID=170555 RepID=A0A7R9EH32_9NEOP|nr:unnamed protein product [Timema monikensis]
MERVDQAEVVNANEASSSSGLWVFGYGSLCWNPGFEFRKSVTGCIKGFIRKFWQGNATHRGTEEKKSACCVFTEYLLYAPEREGGKGPPPLSGLQISKGVVWGRAFLLQGEAALPYLTTRECHLGGYISTITTVYPQHGVDTKPFPALLYLATPNNRHWLGESPLSQIIVSYVCCYRHWLGEAPLHEIACQIMESSGPSGHNVEYLLRLASFMKEQVPEAMDDHLFTLEIMFVRYFQKKCIESRTISRHDDYFYIINKM